MTWHHKTHEYGGWPKKDEEFRLYQEKNKAYLLVSTERHEGFPHFEGIGNVNFHPEPPTLASTGVSPAYIYQNRLKRVEWSDLPEHWQKAFADWFEDFKPEEIRGFWRVKNPKYRKVAKNG